MTNPTLLRLARSAFAASLLVAAAACSTTAAEDASASDADDGIEEDAPELRAGALVGTYRLDASVDPEGQGIFEWIDTLALKSDGTFYADEQGVSFDPDGYNSQIGHFEMRGKYTLKKSADGTKRWIAFAFPLPSGERGTAKYFYKTAPEGLRLHTDIRGSERDENFLLLKRDRMNAWCAEANDCKLQNLPQPRCPGEWKCSKIRPDRVLSYTIDVCRYDSSRCGG